MKLLNHYYSKRVFYLTQSNAATYVKSAPSSRWNPDGITMKVADERDFTRLTRSADKFQHSTRIDDRLRQGDLCVVAYVDDDLAHFRWMTGGNVEVPYIGAQLMMYMNSHEAYTYDAYTFPKYRRRGIGHEARRFLVKTAAQQGVTTLYATSELNNPFMSPTRAQRERKGRAKTLGTITVTAIGRMKRYQFHGPTTADRATIANLFRIPPDEVRPFSDL
jgi:GNAT superfamily N-acetyltransferase